MSKVFKAFRLLFSQTKLRAQEKITYIGRDHLGNKYYEKFCPSNPRANRRYFERDEIHDGEDIVDLTKVPPAWDTWLRFRRKDPPSLEEIEEAEQYFRSQQALLAKEGATESLANVADNDATGFPKRKGLSLKPLGETERFGSKRFEH